MGRCGQLQDGTKTSLKICVGQLETLNQWRKK